MLDNAVSGGSSIVVVWSVGVPVMRGRCVVGCGCCVSPVGVCVDDVLFEMSCLISSGVWVEVSSGIPGHVVAKQRGCQDSP